MLARTVSGWGWQNEMVDLLWTLTKAPETRLEALQLLYQHYAKGGDTGGVYRVLVHSSELAPEDLTMQNNLAQVSLLLDADPERARKIAADLAQKEPANAAFVSTYAFSLYARGDVAAARQALETLARSNCKSLRSPRTTASCLRLPGEKEKAREYLARGAKAFLLPEEKAWWRRQKPPLAKNFPRALSAARALYDAALSACGSLPFRCSSRTTLGKSRL
jgi:Flp pilus assembly protein TadD